MNAPAPDVSHDPLKATAERDDLLAAMQYVAYGVAPRTQLPVLASVMLDATSGHDLLLRTFDYDVEVTQQVAAPQSTGLALVNHKTFRQMLTALPKGCTVHLTATVTALEIQAAGVDYTLPLYPPAEYPDGFSLGKYRSLLTCSGADLALLGRVCTAAGADDTLPVLTAVHLSRHPDTGMLAAAATDRYRLALYDSELKPGIGLPESGMLIPARSLRQLVQSFRKEKQVRLLVADNVLHVEVGGRTFTQRLLDGEFPKYRTLIPTADAPASFTARAETMLTAVQQAAVGTSRLSPVRLHLGAKSEIRSGLDVDRADSPTAVVPLDVDYAGEPVVMAYNPAYLRDGFRVFDKDDRVAMAGTLNKPAVFSSENRPGFLYLLMPVRIAD